MAQNLGLNVFPTTINTPAPVEKALPANGLPGLAAVLEQLQLKQGVFSRCLADLKVQLLG